MVCLQHNSLKSCGTRPAGHADAAAQMSQEQEWTPPTPAEQAVLDRKRERRDKISKRIGRRRTKRRQIR